MDLKSAETMDFNLALDYMKQEYAKSYGEAKFYLHDAIVFLLRYKKLLEEQPQIVRCKDCVRRKDLACPMFDGETDRAYDDWFCADGERKNDG